VFLREVEGLSYREIARRMGLSLAAVETLLFRARRSLRVLLEAEGFRPATQAGRARGVRGLIVLPAFLTRLTDRAQQLFATELTAKVAGAATAVALGTGVVVGTQALPLDAKASADVPDRVGTSALVGSAPAVGDSLGSPRGPQDAPSGARNAGGLDKGSGRPNAGGQSAGQAGGATAPGGDVVSAGGIQAPSAGLPAVDLPDVSVPEVPTPDVSTPDVSTPDVSTPVAGPSVSVDAPVEVPDLPVEVPDLPVDLADLTGGLPGGG
jgi:hypothetical protein